MPGKRARTPMRRRCATAHRRGASCQRSGVHERRHGACTAWATPGGCAAANDTSQAETAACSSAPQRLRASPTRACRSPAGGTPVCSAITDPARQPHAAASRQLRPAFSAARKPPQHALPQPVTSTTAAPGSAGTCAGDSFGGGGDADMRRLTPRQLCVNTTVVHNLGKLRGGVCNVKIAAARRRRGTPPPEPTTPITHLPDLWLPSSCQQDAIRPAAQQHDCSTRVQQPCGQLLRCPLAYNGCCFILIWREDVAQLQQLPQLIGRRWCVAVRVGLHTQQACSRSAYA
jgi:hypothetical protein